MAEVVHYDVRDRVAVVAIDNPPVNALSTAVWTAIEAAMARATADPAVDAIVLTGRARTFAGGADIAAFDALTSIDVALERSTARHALLRRIEDIGKPVVAAMRGHALGGGLELAMACHYRLAAGDTSIGQPEVQLGLIPGAGGSQRLPRLCGPERALAMGTTGAPVSAVEALSAGIVDAVIDGDLLDQAVAFAAARAADGDRRSTRAIVIDADEVAAGLAACATIRGRLPRPARAGIAAHAVVDAIEGCYLLPFDAAAAREREIFAERVVSTESRALRYLFFAERAAAKVPGVSKGRADAIRAAGVVGAGTMGVGIAIAYVSAGIPVLMSEVDEGALERGLTSVRAHFVSAVSKGRMSAQEGEDATVRVTGSTMLADLREVDIVVEAVFEDLALKQDLFAALGRITKPDCILASNTSTLDIDAMAEASGRPTHVIGHHFFSPAHVMKLLEIVRGRTTSPAVIATSIALAQRLRKVPVVVGNAFGFVANRMLAYYMREAYLLLEEGASVAQIDKVLTDFGLGAGPFQMQDIAGIDVGARIRRHLATLGRTRADGPQSAVPDRLFELGRYGQKTGRGWYRYDAGSRIGIVDPEIDVIAAEEAGRRGVRRRAIEDAEILARVTTALANEGARTLDEGIARKAGDIDVIYTCGFGFPRHRGGPMFHADTIGVDVVAERVRDYRQRLGDHWTLSRLLAQLADERGRFTGSAASPELLR